jgi:arylsulfatase A-like enzyme
MAYRPNIVLVVMDSVRADHLSCYGYHRRCTPFLDRLAEQGVLYEQAIAPSYWTLPSHASLFTGLYPSEHSAMRAGLALPDSIGPTMAEVLANAGYRTLAISNNPNISHATRLSRGFDLFQDAWRGSSRPRMLRVLGRAHRLAGWGDDGAHATVSRALQLVRSAAQPFFLFLLFMDTHYPYFPHWASPAGLFQPLRNVRMLPVYARFARKANWGAIMREYPQQRKLLIDLYDAELWSLDRQLRRLVAGLDATASNGSTVLIVTSDHGEGLGDHGLMSHGASLYDSQLRIPLIIRARGLLPANRRSTSQVQLVDIWPGIARRLGLPTAAAHWQETRPDIFDLDTLNGSAEPAYMETASDEGMIGLRASNHKYISTCEGDELYDLAHDPDELRNVAESEPAKLGEMKQQLEIWRERLRPYGGPPSTSSDQEFVAQLKALGYM